MEYLEVVSNLEYFLLDLVSNKLGSIHDFPEKTGSHLSLYLEP